jgi:hypothetical protein
VGSLRAEKSAGQIGVEHGMPFGRGIVLRGLADRGSGVIHQDIEPAKPVGRPVDHRATRGLVGHIEWDEGAAAAKFSDGALGLCGVARRHDNIGARRGEAARHAEPDPAIAACNDGDASR